MGDVTVGHHSAITWPWSSGYYCNPVIGPQTVKNSSKFDPNHDECEMIVPHPNLTRTSPASVSDQWRFSLLKSNWTQTNHFPSKGSSGCVVLDSKDNIDMNISVISFEGGLLGSARRPLLRFTGAGLRSGLCVQTGQVISHQWTWTVQKGQRAPTLIETSDWLN